MVCGLSARCLFAFGFLPVSSLFVASFDYGQWLGSLSVVSGIVGWELIYSWLVGGVLVHVGGLP